MIVTKEVTFWMYKEEKPLLPKINDNDNLNHLYNKLLELTSNLISFAKINPIENVRIETKSQREIIDEADRLIFDIRNLLPKNKE